MPPPAVAPIADTLAILLAGGQGTRLHELTAAECKPAVHFAGAGRIVDFTMANAVRSGLRQMLVATQYCPFTLENYLPDIWADAFDPGRLVTRNGYRDASGRGYRGTADAVTANIAEIDAMAPAHVLILAGDHVYEMDYAAMIDAHRGSGAEATVAVTTVPRATASAFGIVKTDRAGRITGFLEKPADPPGMADDAGRSLVSMGIYVFAWPWLRAALIADRERPGSSHDFGHDILPGAVAAGVAAAYRLPPLPSGAEPYWHDVGTLDAYRLAQLDFADPARAPVALPDTVQPPPGRHASPRWGIGRDPTVEEFLLYTPRPLSMTRSVQIRGSVLLPGARALSGARLTGVIVAPRTIVPAGLVVGEDIDEDRRWFRVTDGGTTLVTTAMLARRASEMIGRPSPLAIAAAPQTRTAKPC